MCRIIAKRRSHEFNGHSTKGQCTNWRKPNSSPLASRWVKVGCSHNVLHQCQKKKLRILFSHFFWSFFFSPIFFLFFSIFFTLPSFFLSSSSFFFFPLFWNKFFEQPTALFLLFCHGSHWCVFGICRVLGTIVAFLLPLPLFLQVSIIFHVSLILGHFLKKIVHVAFNYKQQQEACSSFSLSLFFFKEEKRKQEKEKRGRISIKKKAKNWKKKQGRRSYY